ncbi:metalloregulator ArsR/SmtB family transcription factor [Tersicoccus sp. MR15.9]|uniref:ArsR/SmtB family transcription factor n=1 Tax=Tersicoccus mangrovi TaxID=3121635 RepID=UPI002FE5AC3A
MEISISGNNKRGGLALTFAALADPTRLALVDRLRGGDATVSELAAGFALGTPAISKHLSVLERAGLISRRREAQRRHCHLETGAFERVEAWAHRHTRHWSASLDRLDDYLDEMPEEDR